jgi:hypothetical protein
VLRANVPRGFGLEAGGICVLRQSKAAAAY